MNLNQYPKEIAELKAQLNGMSRMEFEQRSLKVIAEDERDRLKARVEELEAQAILQAVIWDKEVARLKAELTDRCARVMELEAEIVKITCASEKKALEMHSEVARLQKELKQYQ